MKFLVFLGSSRVSSPPRPERLGERVALACVQHLQAHFEGVEVTLVDPLMIEQGPVFKPHFSYAAGRAPESLDALAARIGEADGHVMVSPEYNHSMSPALAHLLNHFGSSLYGFRPSAIVTYSAGQWGGARAAIGMRAFLSELGCLPVSAMIHLPKAQDVLDPEGGFLLGVDAERWRGYFDRTLAQLHWWAEAAAQQRQRADPAARSPGFTRSPAQRNAPE
ncbi:MAG: NAD(P)H-dependent oxidoreductase [Aquimonas sp.]|nr:NAD(P)H-dependent oxidoreductase [Aquimonas sp.]